MTKFLTFEKNKLVNLNYSLNKEIVRTNRASSYSSTTLSGCNTRKYHGLLVSPIKQLGNSKYVLLSSLDETIIQHGSEFNLGLHQYDKNNYSPRGHKYLRDFYIETIPVSIYRVGGVVLQVEKLLVENEISVLLKYTLVEAQSKTSLRLKPFLSFRDIHSLCKANMAVNRNYHNAQNGVVVKLYNNYPKLFMQLSKDAEFIAAPDWYYNIIYKEEQRRGYDYKEDLYVPGYFELNIEKGESVIFSAGLEEAKPDLLSRKFTIEIKKRTPRNNYHNCLINSAQQFFHKTPEGNLYIVTGYPWLRSKHRDSFIALPGLMFSQKDKNTFSIAIDTILKRIHKNGLIPETRRQLDVFSSDTSLWLIWALQKFSSIHKDFDLWKKYGDTIKSIFNAYLNKDFSNIQLHDNGLIYAKNIGRAYTWMNAYSKEGTPITPRYGYAVEVNALWYNALQYTITLAKKFDDLEFYNKWKPIAENCKKSFVKYFWDENKKYLADFVDDKIKNMAVRPNQLLAVAMPYTPLTKEMAVKILQVTESELLTNKGLRTLSPKNKLYKGKYVGSHYEREEAYHQGTVWPFLLQFYVEAFFRYYNKSFTPKAEKIYQHFEEEMYNYGIGTIGEVFNGDPPHKAKGAISVAKSVAALLYIKELINKNK